MSLKNILIIDDEPDMRETLQDALALNGYQSTTADSGLTAFKLIKEGAKPSLILLDLMMPGMDGLSFLESSSAILSRDKTPIILMSAEGRLEIKAKGKMINGILKKPIKLDQLLDVAKRYCG
jgi:two-component system, chemotaxis family, chemotaxis protein CheY